MATHLHLRSLGVLRLDGPDGELLARRRKELALLVVLAGRAPEAVRREELQALFWGERVEERARHSLRQVVLKLRGIFGTSFDATPDTLRLSRDALSFDVRLFDDAVSSGRYADAVSLWHGEFLLGCEDAGGEGFRTWVEVERERLRRTLHLCFEQVSGRLHADGAWRDAAAWDARWCACFPFDERPHLQCVESLCRAGRRSEAESVRAVFRRRLEEELGDEASPEWLEETQRMLRDVVAPAPAWTPPEPVASASVDERVARGRRSVFALVAAVLVVAFAAGVGLVRALRDPQPLLAVGHIELVAVPDSVAAVTQLLSIGLGRSSELRVLSEARVQGVAAQLSEAVDANAALQHAARAAGADEVIEGVLTRRTDGRWRLDLRRIDLATARSLAAYTEEGSDLLDLVDRATHGIARDLGATLPAQRFAGTTTSIGAYRLFQEGLRAHHQGDNVAALRLFRAAVSLDSTFAIAALYAARVAGLGEATNMVELAGRMSARASDHDRLFIHANWLAWRNDPRHIAVAETLAVRYPAEPDAHYQYATALTSAGQFLDAARHYRRVIQLDSIGLTGGAARCFACDAYNAAMLAYMLADSADAAEAIAREWVTRQPTALPAWLALTRARASAGRIDAAIATLDTAASHDRFGMLANDAAPAASDVWLRAGRFATTDAFWRVRLRTNDSVRSGLWHSMAVTSLRMQGRYAEALEHALALRLRATWTPEAPIHEGYPYAVVLFEMGRYRDAALLFDSIANAPFAQSETRAGRHRAWYFTHAATAWAALGDTARLRELEDAVRRAGSLSSYGRDRLLHHYVRGLRLRALGRNTEAVAAFRSSLYSKVEGNTRASHELARTLIDMRRGNEAIDVLRAALAGPIGASGTYSSRTELIELLARAHEVVGHADSARVHYEWVQRAWQGADPVLDARRANIADRLRRR